jgi:diguanylate cyclase (GGDEF)-like protein
MVRDTGYSILIIDDSEHVRKSIKDTLSEESLFTHIHEAQDVLSGFKLMAEKNPDMVIVDLIMPVYDGFTFLQMKNAKPQFLDIPVIVLTSKDDPSSKVQGLEKGAQDYITKPFNEKELLARVKVHLKIKTLQDELKKKNIMLQKISITDDLTRIYNRRYFMQRLKEEYTRAARYKEKISLILIDLDNFKQVNDNYGHQAGDNILVKVAKLMKQQLRGCDFIGRYGGEEFIIILPYTDHTGACTLAERMRISLEQNPFKFGKKNVVVTLSAGISSYPESGTSSYEDLIRKADEALYAAKKDGKNKVCCCPAIS